MNREELERQLDEWLERASAEYGAAEARPGFEARVMANVNSRLTRRRLHFRWLSVATATTAILVFSCFIYFAHFENPPARDIITQKDQKSGLPQIAQGEKPPSIIQAETPTGTHAKKGIHIAVSDTPKEPFLSSRLSDQERYLLTFVKAVTAQASTGESETETGPLKMPDFEISTVQIPKAQNIDMVQLPAAHQSEDQL